MAKKKKKLKGLYAAKYFIGGLISGIKGAKQSKKDIQKADQERLLQLQKEEELRKNRQQLTMSPEVEKLKEGLGGTEIQRREEQTDRAKAAAMAAATRGGTRVDAFAAMGAGDAQASKLAQDQAEAQRRGLEAGMQERGKLRDTQEAREQADYARQAQLADYAREDVMAGQSNLAAYQQQQYSGIDAGIGTLFGLGKDGMVSSRKKSLKEKIKERMTKGVENKDVMEAGEPEVTPGEFSHEKNPIDLVQKNGENGAPEKIGEMTGGEAIVPPKNVKQMRKMIKENNGEALVKLMDRLLTKWDKEAEDTSESRKEFKKTMAKHGAVHKPRMSSGKQMFAWDRESKFKKGGIFK